ncbi:TPA: 16S rRNA (cytosine(1402)-N(4))-methyltransferase RsmH [bacterium]|nr:16S rRNA (cytosine(1402)-N(4))-methyltransferase RsmH [bacterium]
MDTIHIPVMPEEVISHLVIGNGGIYIDGTLGIGGHTSKILNTDTESTVIGIDLDRQALDLAQKRLNVYGNRVSYIHGNFADIDDLAKSVGVSEVDGILLDLGVSSLQFDSPERGFSFKHIADLDMRMDTTKGQPISYDINKENADKLAEIIYKFGEERWAKKIAKTIVIEREKEPIKTTTQLAKIIESIVPRSGEHIHPATRTFQALRIYKNKELDNLEQGIRKAVNILKVNGRICIISFHSLEDRIIKEFFKYESLTCICPAGTPICICNKKQTLKIITKKPIVPSEEEIKSNKRSRSAKLRVAQKIKL